MALDFKQVPVMFEGGLDQKSPTELVLPGFFNRLENCVRRKKNLVQKRNGYDHLSKSVTDGTSISAGYALASYQSGLHMFSGESLYAYAANPDRWLNRGAAPSISFSAYSVQRNTNAAQSVSSAINENYVCYVSRNTDGRAYVSVYDTDTNQAYMVNQEVAAALGPRVVAIGTYFYIIYRTVAGTVFWKRIDIGSPSTLSAATDLAFTDAGGCLDADYYNTDAIFIAYASNVNTTRIFYLRADGTVGSPINGGYPAIQTIANDGDTAVSVRADPGNEQNFVVSVSDASGAVVINRVSFDFSSVVPTTATTLAASGTGAANAISLATSSTTVYAHIGVTGTSNRYDKTGRWTGTFSGGAWSGGAYDSTWLNQARPFSRTIHYNGNKYFVAVHVSSLQSTYFLVKDGTDPTIVGRYYSGVANADAIGNVHMAQTGGSNEVWVPVLVASRLVAEDGVISGADYGVSALKLNFNDPVYRPAELGGDLHIAGGSHLTTFDGQSTIEHGFALYPEDVTAARVAGGGSITGNGTYYVAAVYEWLDNAGNTHRSAPSVTTSVGSIVANDRITVTVPTLSLTDKHSGAGRSAIKIKVYRGVVDQDAVLYYDSVADNVVNGAETVTITLSQSDEDLADNEVLYTTGGVLENSAPPPATVSWVHKNRMWLGGLEDGNALAYSKEYVPGDGVGFNDGQRIQVDPAGGAVTAIASLDDKLIIFKKDRILALAGDGPLSTGAQSDYGNPVLITADVGTTIPESIAQTPNGLMFKSDKGIYLLTRSLGTEYVGAGVEDHNDLTVTSAVVREDENEVRFTTSDGTTLVYNYLFGIWSTFTNYASVAGISLDGTYYTLTSAGQVRKENSGFLDAGARVAMVIETAWFAFAGLQGFQRVRGIEVLGQRQNDHVTKLSVAYDYEDAYLEDIYFDVDTDLGITYYGAGATYGASTPYGGSGSSVYQFFARPRRQKCESLKIRLTDIDSDGGSFNLVAMTMDVGLKNMMNKSGRSPDLGGS